MQPRRHEDYNTFPSDPKMKLRDREIGFGHDPYAPPRRDFLERSPHSRKSLSPRRAEGSRRLLDVNGRNNSLERREDYGRDFAGGGSGGGRGERVRSRSPPFVVNKRSHHDEGVSSRHLPELRRRYGFVDRMDVNADRLTREKEYDGSRLLGTSGPGMSSHELMGLEDDAVRNLFRLPKGSGTTSKYGEGGARFSLSSSNLDIGQYKDERVRYADPLLLDKLSGMESYREREKPMFYSRDGSYPQVSGTQSKDYNGSSFGISRSDFQGSYQDGMPLLADEYRSSAKIKDNLGFSGHAEMSTLDSGRDHNTEHKDLAHYRRDTFIPTRAERQDYFNRRPGGGDSDIYGYSSDEFYKTMSAREPVDYDHKDLLRSEMRDPMVEYADNREYTSRNVRDNSLQDHPSMRKQTVSSYLGIGVSPASKGEEYFGSKRAHVEFGRRGSGDQDIPHSGVPEDHKISHLRLDYDFGRDAGPASRNERMRNSPELKYETEMHTIAGRTYEIEEDHGMYDSFYRGPKRQYHADEEMSRLNSRSIVSSKWYDTSRVRDLHDRNEEWTGQDSDVSYSPRSVGYDDKLYQREERKFGGADRHRADRHRVSEFDDWLPSHDSMEHVQEHSMKPYKPGGRYSKGHLRPGPQSSNSSYRYNKRHFLPNNVWIRGKDDKKVDVHENEVDLSEDWVSSARSEPPEDSEEFKQMVHKAFLIFSKRLNETPSARKRYKEQGRAGSLFCIVCGRSTSKEFMDTQRLVTHAYMSHKVRLRAQHLGLHKAICVLLGWNSVVAPDVQTWVPEVFPEAEARAQKEDLILWPPVIIIHDSSIEENYTDECKFITLEAAGDFLRGKGFSGGKFKTCYGRPANRSVIVVKFSGTFSGLKDAERLHEYFVESKRGRADFERAAYRSGKGKSSGNSGVGAKQGRNVELVLYGYMGIAEDLDRVDIDTKRKCLIKSKKEIQEFANAPVKPE
ncbi:hypothetical protein Acr_22g0005900 [Actinidia rufa]|uniref:XS domain-containing protein n=1 Tax=Actinidia rufa TaxID=165716 RepID=A0A7J0GKA0_9ERIC|nr:hypothetical protein Acr_22g0005900 [Actinidia rufa]